MLPTLTRALSRELDRRAIDQYGLSGLVLMENAGRGLADALQALEVAGPVAIACGKGNNGGDGFVLARHLDLRGVEARVLLWANPDDLTGDAASNYAVLSKCGISMEAFGNGAPDDLRLAELLDGVEWIVDALLGTGSVGAPRAPIDAAIAALNAHPAAKLAVDLPSGLDADTGQPSPTTIRAEHTCTFVAAKTGFLAPEAQPYLGTLHVLDVGAPRKLVQELLAESARQG